MKRRAKNQRQKACAEEQAKICVPIFLGLNGLEAKAEAFHKLRQDIESGIKAQEQLNFSRLLLTHVHKAAAQLTPPPSSKGPTPSKNVKRLDIMQYEVLVLYGYTPAAFGFGPVKPS